MDRTARDSDGGRYNSGIKEGFRKAGDMQGMETYGSNGDQGVEFYLNHVWNRHYCPKSLFLCCPVLCYIEKKSGTQVLMFHELPDVQLCFIFHTN